MSKRSAVSARTPRYRHTEVALAIGRQIVSGEWSPGQALQPEDALSRELGVSRSSLREAIKILAGKGLVQSSPRRGTVVRPHDQWNLFDADVLAWHSEGQLSADFVRELFELRRMIEPDAAALAAERAIPAKLTALEAAMAALAAADTHSTHSIDADLAFHSAVLAASGNHLLAALAPVIEASLTLAFRVSRTVSDELGHVIPMHGAVVEAILSGDAAAAHAAMRGLLERSERDALAVARPDRMVPQPATGRVSSRKSVARLTDALGSDASSNPTLHDLAPGK
ncbi:MULTISPECIES: FadR/GntR family transcriptional regulator [unclassified Chelatococcus]|uniref:FadR/GntR family transcriptional regulator n=1 Tax=unclassified Chelatococcus TaxID=2638111 RepID=UPI001BCF095C|nr:MULTISPECIES: FadR/GntR family transcriptional regulator [unclassified Chelatococcus]CAH1666163.1 GntR family transcriptional regulator [Hyphomicrobiales bacterium]MBS7737822.1 FadR family transcriptional regulator [Chelatococcus sp. HY11]MBX3546730.1 FadR family transcriptional regulator [Chelatococcus sp.]MCO5079276.1 FadR family transcriptional regulator [Chelatococcus sp.]CAH1680826.1 GntR family transcriptional regulator [Hyphomicrobiales bacterium]